jgi:nucleotide-binding universal stress UspA family protein
MTLTGKGILMIVVAGVDGSQAARRVVETAAEQARWRDADLHLVHASYVPVVYADVPIDLGEFTESERRAVWDIVRPLAEGLDVAYELVDLDGYPPDTLVSYANDVDACLLVVGTRGRGDFASLILGSTAHRAIQLAHCDVLVAKEGEGGETR